MRHVIVGVWLVCVAGCAGAPAEAPAAPAAPAAAPHANLAQLMRAIPFGHSNIVFDTQTEDPAAPKKPEEGGAGASARFASIYTGWPVVESSALALAETANLLLLPGRLCENGRPVPIDREDFRKFTQGLVDAGLAAYKAAQTKSMDAMVEASGTVADACAACHEVYRDKPEGQPRCVP